mmetsp:Transcript_14078/g.20810  ORF Transcript_14078/g.20810 Transcript_14078/m.20810 type:complete len:141 (-) Transcript_14078:17-439(-)
MLPLSLLNKAQSHPMLVELKNGDTYNGRLEMCDNWLNIKLADVIWTSRDGDKFHKLKEIFVRGNSIKYMTIPDEVMELVVEEEEQNSRLGRAGAAWRGGHRGRGRVGRGGNRGRGRSRGRGNVQNPGRSGGTGQVIQADK